MVKGAARFYNSLGLVLALQNETDHALYLLSAKKKHNNRLSDIGSLIAAYHNEIAGDAQIKDFHTLIEQLFNLDSNYEFPDVIAEIANRDNYIFCLAAEKGNIAVVNRLLTKSPDGYEFSQVINLISARNNYAFRKAACAGHLAVVNRLLAKNPDGTYEFPQIIEQSADDYNQALLGAVMRGNSAVVDRLIEKKADDTYEFPHFLSCIDEALFMLAGDYGHINLVNIILAKNPDKSYKYPDIIKNIANNRLYVAAGNGHLEVVNRLLAKNSDGTYEFPEIINKISEFNNTILNKAMRNDRLAVVKRLLNRKADNTYEFPTVASDIWSHFKNIAESEDAAAFNTFNWLLTNLNLSSDERNYLFLEFMRLPLKRQANIAYNILKIESGESLVKFSLKDYLIPDVIHFINQYNRIEKEETNFAPAQAKGITNLFIAYVKNPLRKEQAELQKLCQKFEKVKI